MTSTSADSASASPQQKKPIPGFAQFQRIGRSLMLPIASLPVAALLNRFGAADVLGADGLSKIWPWVQPVADVLAAAGGAIFDNLPLIFALGVAVGYAKKADGSTALAALIGYLTLTGAGTAAGTQGGVLGALAPHFAPATPGSCAAAVASAGLDAADFDCAQPTYAINYGVLGGIIIGVIAALCYQRFRRIKLPTYLAFFGGRRFVPIVTAAASLVAGVVLALIYPAFNWLINQQVGGFIMTHGSNPGTGFVFGAANRLLIPLGLHHLLNSLPWFQLGDCTNAAGATLHGDITCFFQGTPETAAWTGSFMTGFFPIMMFALPGAALAIYHTARPEKKKVTGGVMISVALTAFLTGITEPLEYAFAYVAFPLYLVHVVLTGSSLALVNALGIKDGFGFSAGLTDYLLNFGKAAELSGGAGKVLLLIPIGLVYAVIYYVIFRWAITKWNLHTPGREEDGEGSAGVSVFDEAQTAADESTGKAAAAREDRG